MVKGVMVKMDVHPTGVVPAEVIFSGIEASIPSLNLTDIFLWLFSIHTMIAIKAMAIMANNKKYSKGLCSCDIIFIKMCQNTPQLCWGDEWPPLSPGGRGLG